VIFADEPTGNLDDASAEIVWQALVGHAATGATVVVSTHDKALAARSDLEVTLTTHSDEDGHTHDDGHSDGDGHGNGVGVAW
jgi:ABC-type lipoprotein export system ATPase subunit